MVDENLTALKQRLSNLTNLKDPLKYLYPNLQENLLFLENPRVPKRFSKLINQKLDEHAESEFFHIDEKGIRSLIKVIISIFACPLQLGIPEFREIFNKIYPESWAIEDLLKKLQKKKLNKEDILNILLSQVIYLKILQVFNNNVEDPRMMDFLLDIYLKFDLKNLNFIESFTRNKLNVEFDSNFPKVKVKNLVFSIFGSCEKFKFFQSANQELSPIFEKIIEFELVETSLKVELKNQESGKIWQLSQLGVKSSSSRFDRITTIGSYIEADIVIPDPSLEPLVAGVFLYKNFMLKQCSEVSLKFIIEPRVFVLLQVGRIFEINEKFEIEYQGNENFAVFKEGRELKDKEMRYQNIDGGILHGEILGNEIDFFLGASRDMFPGFFFLNENLRVLAHCSNFNLPANGDTNMENTCEIFENFKRVEIRDSNKISINEEIGMNRVSVSIGQNILEFTKFK